MIFDLDADFPPFLENTGELILGKYKFPQFVDSDELVNGQHHRARPNYRSLYNNMYEAVRTSDWHSIKTLFELPRQPLSTVSLLKSTQQ